MSTKLERLRRENASMEAEIGAMDVAIAATRSKIYVEEEGRGRRSSTRSWKYADFIREAIEAEDEEEREKVIEKYVNRMTSRPGTTRVGVRKILLAKLSRYEEEEEED